MSRTGVFPLSIFLSVCHKNPDYDLLRDLEVPGRLSSVPSSTHLKSEGNCELDVFVLRIVIFGEIFLIFDEILETALILLLDLELVFPHPFALSFGEPISIHWSKSKSLHHRGFVKLFASMLITCQDHFHHCCLRRHRHHHHCHHHHCHCHCHNYLGSSPGDLLSLRMNNDQSVWWHRPEVVSKLNLDVD